MIWKKQPVGSKLSDLQNNKASKDTATQSAAGLMSASDKTKLDGVATGATAVSVVNNLNSDSTTSALSAAQGKALNSNIANIITTPNTYTSSGCFVGYNTGSGNYVDFFIPIIISNTRTVSSVSFKGSVFFGTTRHNVSNITSVEVIAVSRNGLLCEFTYPSTQTQNVQAMVYAETLSITVT